MDATQIAELLEPFLSIHDEHTSRVAAEPESPARRFREATEKIEESRSDATLLRNISTYIDLLLRWNARINLTAIREPEQIVTRHFGESLFAARHLFPGNTHVGLELSSSQAEQGPAVPANDQPPITGDVIDIGSGAGFPGLPIKLWAPRIHMTLIESNQKKVAFLREIIRTLTLTDIDVFPGRAEDFKDQSKIVTLRAVEHFAAALPIAARLVAGDGRLALLIGEGQVEQAHILLPTAKWQDPIGIPLSSTRVLLIGRPTANQESEVPKK